MRHFGYFLMTIISLDSGIQKHKTAGIHPDSMCKINHTTSRHFLQELPGAVLLLLILIFRYYDRLGPAVFCNSNLE